MTKSKKVLSAALFAVLILPINALSTEEIFKRFAESLAVPTLQGTFKVQLISKNGDTREIEARAYQKQFGEVQNNRLFIFDFPPNVRGTGLLLHSFFDGRPNNMWIYLPAVRRVKRIALESSGGGYFMGSDFTYQDLINNDVDDLVIEQLPETVKDGIDCYVLKAEGRTPEIKQDKGYSHMISYHPKDTFHLYIREYYDFEGELLKVYKAEDYLELSPGIYPTRISMTNVQTGHKSILQVDDVSTEEIPDRFFTTRYLQNN